MLPIWQFSKVWNSHCYLAAIPKLIKNYDMIQEKGIKIVDFKFTDLPGTWQHFSIPAASLDEAMIREGLGFDGSSIRGFLSPTKAARR